MHLLAWYAQIHPACRVREEEAQRADGLAQSLVLAPLFVWMEVMFACGYRPGLRSDVDRRVKRAVEEREPRSQGRLTLGRGPSLRSGRTSIDGLS